jgi:hypothetical protein
MRCRNCDRPTFDSEQLCPPCAAVGIPPPVTKSPIDTGLWYPSCESPLVADATAGRASQQPTLICPNCPLEKRPRCPRCYADLHAGLAARGTLGSRQIYCPKCPSEKQRPWELQRTCVVCRRERLTIGGRVCGDKHFVGNRHINAQGDTSGVNLTKCPVDNSTLRPLIVGW